MMQRQCACKEGDRRRPAGCTHRGRDLAQVLGLGVQLAVLYLLRGHKVCEGARGRQEHLVLHSSLCEDSGHWSLSITSRGLCSSAMG